MKATTLHQPIKEEEVEEFEESKIDMYLNLTSRNGNDHEEQGDFIDNNNNYVDSLIENNNRIRSSGSNLEYQPTSSDVGRRRTARFAQQSHLSAGSRADQFLNSQPADFPNGSHTQLSLNNNNNRQRRAETLSSNHGQSSQKSQQANIGTSNQQQSSNYSVVRRTVSALFAGIGRQSDSLNLNRLTFNRRQYKRRCVVIKKRAIGISNPNIYNALFNLIPPSFDAKKKRRQDLEEKKWWESLVKQIPVFRPDNMWFLLWEFLIFILTCVIFFTIPIDLMFQVHVISSGPFSYGRFLIFILLAIDAIFKLNVAFYEKGKLVIDRLAIVKNYFSHFLDGNGMTDLLGLFGLFIADLKNSQQLSIQSFASLFFYVRLININLYDSLIIKKLQLNRKTKCAYQLLRLAIVVIFISNVWACLFYRVGMHEKENGLNCWLDQITAKVPNPNLQVYYLYSLYWSVTTMISVGYGDIIPVQPFEVIVTILCMLCSCIVFAYSINSIWQLISEVSMGDKRYEQNMNAINRYMRDKSISSSLTSRIQAYLDFQWKDKKSRDEAREKEIVESLPQNLKLELIQEANSFFFEKFEWSKQFSPAFVQLLAQYIQEKKYLEGDIIYHQSEMHDEWDPSFYFLEEGEIQMNYDLPFYNEGFGIPIQVIKKGHIFGLYEFFSGEQPRESARCSELSNLFSISRSDFLKVISNFPSDNEKYLKLREKMLMNRDYSYFGLKCSLCGKNDHLSHMCVQSVIKEGMLAKRREQARLVRMVARGIHNEDDSDESEADNRHHFGTCSMSSGDNSFASDSDSQDYSSNNSMHEKQNQNASIHRNSHSLNAPQSFTGTISPQQQQHSHNNHHHHHNQQHRHHSYAQPEQLQEQQQRCKQLHQTQRAGFAKIRKNYEVQTIKEPRLPQNQLTEENSNHPYHNIISAASNDTLIVDSRALAGTNANQNQDLQEAIAAQTLAAVSGLVSVSSNSPHSLPRNQVQSYTETKYQLQQQQQQQQVQPLNSVSSTSSFFQNSNSAQLNRMTTPKTPPITANINIEDDVQLLEDEENKKLREGFEGKIRKSRHFSSLVDQKDDEIDQVSQPSVFVQTHTEILNMSSMHSQPNMSQQRPQQQQQQQQQNAQKQKQYSSQISQLQSTQRPRMQQFSQKSIFKSNNKMNINSNTEISSGTTPLLKSIDSMLSKNPQTTTTTTATPAASNTTTTGSNLTQPTKKPSQQQIEANNKALIHQNISIQHRIKAQRKSSTRLNPQAVSASSNLLGSGSFISGLRKQHSEDDEYFTDRLSLPPQLLHRQQQLQQQVQPQNQIQLLPLENSGERSESYLRQKYTGGLAVAAVGSPKEQEYVSMSSVPSCQSPMNASSAIKSLRKTSANGIATNNNITQPTAFDIDAPPKLGMSYVDQLYFAYSLPQMQMQRTKSDEEINQ